MNKKIGLIAAFFVLGVGAVWMTLGDFCWNSADHPITSLNQNHEFIIQEGHQLVGFNLVDPEQAPPKLKDSVMRGYHIIMDTQKNAKEYAGDKLNCTNCHFLGGDTLGGENNGISLVGVTTHYPSYSERSGKVISLADRINNCFERSLNGKPLPKDSQMMQDIIAYLSWISKEVAHLKMIPWLGLEPLKSKHMPDPKQGEAVYMTYCAMCHKENGEGVMEGNVLDFPPLWGASSFNEGAGMSKLPKLASFIYWNMPHNSPMLTEEQSLDVAAFILSKPRSKF